MHIQPIDNATDLEPYVVAAIPLNQRYDVAMDDAGTGDTFDDVWGSEPSSPTAQDSTSTAPHQPRLRDTTHPSDIPRLRAEHTTAGYREGVTAGKADSLQAGFDEGFRLGAAIGAKAGELIGLLEGIANALARHTDVALSSTAAQTLQEARTELAKDRLFTSEYFNPDGTWKYAVGASHPELESDAPAEGDIVFADVADAHPLIKRWAPIVDSAMERWNIDRAVFAEARDNDQQPGHLHGHDHGRDSHHPATGQPHDGQERQAPASSSAPPTKKPLDW